MINTPTVFAIGSPEASVVDVNPCRIRGEGVDVVLQVPRQVLVHREEVEEEVLVVLEPQRGPWATFAGSPPVPRLERESRNSS